MTNSDIQKKTAFHDAMHFKEKIIFKKQKEFK